MSKSQKYIELSLFDQRDREAVLLGETPEDNPDRKEYLDFDKITANAALIAAAPEMYAMLEDLLDKFRNDEFAPEIEKLLKKARGEA